MKKRWILALALLCLSLLSACQETTAPTDHNNPSLLRTSTKHQQHTSEKVEALIYEEHEFQDVIAVNSDDLIVIGIDPLHHDRFQLKEFRKDLKKTVESSFSSYDIELSTDKKITLELSKLKEQLANGELSSEQLKKELEKIQTLSKEQT